MLIKYAVLSADSLLRYFRKLDFRKRLKEYQGHDLYESYHIIAYLIMILDSACAYT